MENCRSGYGIKNPMMAANICNAIVDRVDKIHKEIYLDFYASTLQKLEQIYAQKLSFAQSCRFEPGKK